MATQPYIWFRGHRMTAALRDAILAAEQRAGFQFVITQGGFNRGGVAASAGTHDGDAADFRTWHLNRAQVGAMIEALRWAGIAAWYRTTNTAHYGVRPHGFAHRHVHAVPNGWGSPSAGARRQADAYRRGRDGLAGNGTDRGGPGHVVTWYGRTSPRRIGLPDSGTAPKPTPAPKPDARTDLERLLDTMTKDELLDLMRSAIRAESGTARAAAEDGINRVLTNREWRLYGGGSDDLSTLPNAVFLTERSARQALAIIQDLAKRSGVDIDEHALAQSIAASIAPTLKQAVQQAVEAGGSPETIAEAVVTRMGAALIEG